MTDDRICATIDGVFYFPTVPASGYSVSRRSAIMVEGLLEHAPLDSLRNEATPLQRAIDSDSKAAMVQVFLHLENSVCPLLGVPPVT